MSDTPNLRIPGPTPVPADILEAVAHPMINHRGREFAALISRVAERLKDWFQTSNDVLILSAPGTGGVGSAGGGRPWPGGQGLLWGMRGRGGGLGVGVTGSEKGWMVPPGLAFVSMSERAWRAYENAKMPRFYLDLGRHRDALPKGQTPWTPAMSIFFGLDAALERMAEEGAERVFTRHASMGRMVREGVKGLGLELLCQDKRFASDTVTAIKCPEGIEVSALRNA